MLTHPPARLVDLLGQRKRGPPSPGHLVSRPGAVLPVCTVESILTLLGMLEVDELHLASLVAAGFVLLVLVVLVGGPFLGRHGSHHLTTLLI